MATRKLLYQFNRTPYGNVFYTEGWRAAVGATAGIDEHEVTLLLQGDGVYYALKGADRAENLGYEGTLKKAGVKYFVVFNKKPAVSRSYSVTYPSPFCLPMSRPALS